MVHLVPMSWNHEEGDTVEVWAYANVDTVELFLNGKPLGIRKFDTKATTDGRTYLETTEATGDDKTFTDGPYPGSYTSPNGSAGKLHLAWKVPYEPGELKAVARRNGKVVAGDVLRTAKDAHALRLTTDRSSLAADGRSLVFVTAEVVDVHGVVVPDAEHLITFDVAGGSLAGLDNGREESAERYQASTRTAFHGKALALVRSGTRAGSLKVTARADGLRTATATVRATGAPSRATTPAPVFKPDHPAAPDYPVADAGYSGRPDTLPAAMLDGDPATGWSNAFVKSATALLPAFSGARASDWVSVDWGRARSFDRVEVSFTVDATHTAPASVEVSVGDGRRYRPVTGAAVDWATASDAPTVITFDTVRGSRLRLLFTSAHPGAANGAVRVSRLEVPAG
jgi:beta-galactosidase